MHEIKRTNEIDIENYIRNSNDLMIVVTSSYNQENRQGIYTCLMLYQGHRKVITAQGNTLSSLVVPDGKDEIKKIIAKEQ